MANSGSGQFIRKTGDTTFENATPSGDGTTTAVKKFTTTGGVETIILGNTPSIIIAVVVHGQDLSDDAGDYAQSGTSVNLLNPNTPAGLFGRVVYAYWYEYT